MKSRTKFAVMTIMVLMMAGTVQGAGFLEIEGVKGETTAHPHEGWIEIISYDWGVQRSEPETTGRRDRQGDVSINDFVLTKRVDTSSPYLMEAVASGTVFREATVELTRFGGDEPIAYLRYNFNNVRVTSYTINHTEETEEVPIERVALRFDEMEVTYTPLEQDGTPSNPITFFWDILRNLVGVK